MEEIDNFSKPIQALMENVKKDILTNIDKRPEKTHNKEIINLLFNLLDYQITLMNQILLFNKNNNNEDKDNQNSIDYLIRINKGILVSMINKFVNNINSIFNKGFRSENKKNYLNNRSKIQFDHGKVTNKQYSTIDNYNNNYIFNSSFGQYNSPIKKNMEKEFNSVVSKTQQSSAQKFMTSSEKEKDSYKFLKNKNMIYNQKYKTNKNVYDKLYFGKDTRCDHIEKHKNKILQYQALSKSMKDLFVDLNNDNMKKHFNKINNRINSSTGKKPKEQFI